MPEPKASCGYCRNNRRNRRESTRTGKKKRGRQEIHRVPLSELAVRGFPICRGNFATKNRVRSRTLSYPARNSVFIGLVSRAEPQPRKKPRTPPKSIQRPKCWGCRAPYQTGRTMKERTRIVIAKFTVCGRTSSGNSAAPTATRKCCQLSRRVDCGTTVSSVCRTVP